MTAKEYKSVIFKEKPGDPEGSVEFQANTWMDMNRDKISDFHGVHGIVQDIPNSPAHSRRTAVIRFIGEGTSPSPSDCLHTLTEEKVIQEAECGKPGVMGVYCIECGFKLSEKPIPAEDHTFEYASNGDATCIEDGTRTATCTNCGHSEVIPDPGSALGHDYQWSTSKSETCFSDREETGVCSRCQDTQTRTVPDTQLTHEYTEYVYNNDATCEKDGTETATCNHGCGTKDTRTKDGSVLGHEYTNYVYNNDATCTEDGTETATCEHGCRKTDTRTKSGSALGHEYPEEWTVRTKPTADSEGLKFKKCIRCDNEITETIPKLEHHWISNGDGTHTCDTPECCGATEDCSPNGYGEVCSKCGYTTPDIVFSITTDKINEMKVGTPFSQQLTASKEFELTWSLMNGNLPNGVTLSPEGVLSGTPTDPGVSSFNIKCVHRNKTATIDLSATVSE